MLTPTPVGAVWPARLAYCAAAIFTLASAGTNLNYGISKGTDAASSAAWAAVSIAVSIVFAVLAGVDQGGRAAAMDAGATGALSDGSN